MEKMPHDDAAGFCLIAALDELLIPGKRRRSPTFTSVSWKGQTAQCLGLGFVPPLSTGEMPHAEVLVPAEFRQWTSSQLASYTVRMHKGDDHILFRIGGGAGLLGGGADGTRRGCPDAPCRF
jgi:hypothetical protein